jgi:hypothetical protein
LTGTAPAITSELGALVFTPAFGKPGTSTTSTFTLSDVGSAGGSPVVDSTTTVINKDVPTPTITVGGQTTTNEAPVTPFMGVTIWDPNAGATDTLTITIGGGGGTLADGVGFSGLTSAGVDVYTLTGTVSTINSELDALVFTPYAGKPGTSTTSTFALSDVSSAGGAPVVDLTTTVIDKDVVPPTDAETAGGQTTTSEAPVTPFKGVIIIDANADATDTLTITLGGVGGTLSGAGLTGGNGGVYTLSGTAATITSELDALVFTPKAGALNTSSMTTFTLSDLSSAGGAPAVDSTTTVIDKTATTIIETRPHAHVDAKHHPPGQPPLRNGHNVIFALGVDDIIKPPGANNTEVGGAPGDLLYGGAGDNFVFQTLKASPASHPDIIMNFSERRGDHIDLHDLHAFVPGHQPLVFIGGQSFAHYHHHHTAVFGMVRDAQGLVQVNVNQHLTTEMEIVVHGPPTLHAFDFIL